ncbi:MAG: BCCT family transporter [Actinomycetaceae bacterium]|nr:BCCT family transporter [Actinomycetaceae bacterium]
MTAPTTDATEMVKSKSRAFTPGVFWPSAILIVIFVFLAIFYSEGTKEHIDAISSAVVDNVGWYYILAVSGFVVFALAIAFSRKGDTILGADDAKPEYSRVSWFSMLFAAGMGIGLVFWGAAEPLNHYGNPKPGGSLSGALDETTVLTDFEKQERATDAMNTTFLHWGLHAWAVYVVVGLAVAYAVHRKGLPVSMRWTLKPILGDRVNGRLGDVIDVIAIIGTLFGISTSLGSGVGQVGEGLNFLWNWEVTPGMLVALVIIISGLAALSVATGLDAGIKFLSNTNLVLAALLMVGVFTLGPTLFISNEFVSGLGQYFQNFIGSSLETLSFSGAEGSSWLQGWTVYYWGWWISWSPFVGIFIARISKGRTVREFIAGVLLVPTLITFIWFAILGGNGLYQEVFGDANLAASLIGDEGTITNASALFAVFESMPIASILSTIFCVVAIILVIIFFVTSSDSGSYVMSMIATGGNPNPALRVRLTFATLAGAITAAMLGWSDDSAAALSALQNLAILAALPFSVILILMCWATWKELRAEQMLRRWAERVEFAKTLSDHVSSEVTTGIYDEISSHRTKARPIETTVDLRRFFERLSRKRAESAEEASGSVAVKTQDVYEVPDVATGPEGPTTAEIAADYEAYLNTAGFISTSSEPETDEAEAAAQADEAAGDASAQSDDEGTERFQPPEPPAGEGGTSA